MYDRLTCYYLSGTGNSYRAAKWLAATASDRGVGAEIVPISDAKPKEELIGGKRQLVGIYHPTHGLMPPWSMIKFLLRLPWGRGAHAVVVATRGAFPIRPLIVPGGAGLALFFPMLVLMLKGYRVRGGMGIDMPANMINVHPGFNRRNVAHIIAWGKRRHQRFADYVTRGKFYVHPANVLWELLWCIPFWFWPITPIAYLLVARIFMAKMMFADASCKGCGTCARNCPSEAIKMVGSKPKTPFWTYHCEVCMRCVGYCKVRAAQPSHSWMILMAYATSFLSASMVQDMVANFWGGRFQLVDFGWEMVSLALVFVSLPIAYYFFFAVTRLRPVLLLFTYTTLTKLYKRRYHEPNTKSRDMRRRSFGSGQ